MGIHSNIFLMKALQFQDDEANEAVEGIYVLKRHGITIKRVGRLEFFFTLSSIRC